MNVMLEDNSESPAPYQAEHLNVSYPTPKIETPPGLDPGIRYYVEVLNWGGIYTLESCQGGEGHAYPVPTVRFTGPYSDGWKALSLAQTFGLPVAELCRVWRISDGEVEGPFWDMTFDRPCTT